MKRLGFRVSERSESLIVSDVRQHLRRHLLTTISTDEFGADCMDALTQHVHVGIHRSPPFPPTHTFHCASPKPHTLCPSGSRVSSKVADRDRRDVRQRGGRHLGKLT